MDAPTSAQELLTAYGQLIGLPNLRFEPHGCARLMFSGAIAVDLEIDHAASGIQVYGVLGPVPAGDRESLYRNLLEANLFTVETFGATLSVDKVQEEIILSRRVELATASAASFAQLLQEFAGVLDVWRRKFASGELTTGSTRESLPQDSQFGLLVRG